MIDYVKEYSVLTIMTPFKALRLKIKEEEENPSTDTIIAELRIVQLKLTEISALCEGVGLNKIKDELSQPIVSCKKAVRVLEGRYSKNAGK
jgi:hypothetical protein